MMSENPKRPGLWKRRILPGLKYTYCGLMAVEVWVHRAKIPWWACLFPVAVIAAGVLTVVIIRRFHRHQTLNRQYRRLRFSWRGLHYSDRGGKRWTIPWNTIVKISVSKEFGFSSPAWHDTIWIIRQRDGRTTRLDDEYQDHDALVLVFCVRLPGFSFFAAKRGCDSDELGEATCFERIYVGHY